MAINSKTKGSTFERKLAKMLSEWSGQEFHRTPMSGALHWANDKRVISDIVPPQVLVDAGWPFSIEAKCVECSWEFNTFMEGTSVTLQQHWKQCYEDSQREGLLPMLVFKKNRRDVYMMITESLFKELDIEPASYITVKTQSDTLVILKFKEFLSLISCDEILGLQLFQ